VKHCFCESVCKYYNDLDKPCSMMYCDRDSRRSHYDVTIFEHCLHGAYCPSTLTTYCRRMRNECNSWKTCDMREVVGSCEVSDKKDSVRPNLAYVYHLREEK
jgi:hypothetical protein